MAALGEDKTVCAGKFIPLLNPWVSVMISRYGASGTGVDEMPVCFGMVEKTKNTSGSAPN